MRRCLWVCAVIAVVGALVLSGCATTTNEKAESISATIKQYIDSAADEVAGLQSDILSVKLSERNGSIVYMFTYRITSVTADEANKARLDQLLNIKQADYVAKLSKIRESAPDTVSLIVEYYDIHGTLIISKEFNTPFNTTGQQ